MAVQKNNTGVAFFDSGLGNTLTITFPKVQHERIYMNTGVAFMPLMQDGYHFLKETTEQPSKTLGLNDVEVGFVKYLYKIRQANRTQTQLNYSLFSGPRGAVIRERVFIAGKIFPVMSIWYSGEAIDCNTANITVKSTTLAELRVRFGEHFNEYQAFSLSYISIDNDNLKIYLPKNTTMGIDYQGLLLDFLTNGKNTNVAASHGEFPDIDTYTLATGNTTLQNGCWLTNDRNTNTTTWQDGCMYIVEHKLQGVLAPFGQIADFYTLLDTKITNETTHKTRWLKGAKKLVNSLKIMDGGFIAIANDVETILNELNIGICDYAITQFYELFYGKYKDKPLAKLQEAYEFDLQFVKHEQGVVAVPIYSKTNKQTIEKYQDMADQDAKGVHGLGGFIADQTLLKVIPEFDEPWQGKVTDAQFRIDLPMLMLWLDRHKPKAKNFKDKIDKNGYLLEKFKKIIRSYEAK